MEKSKLIDLLRALEANEWRSFLDFVSSPYYNKDPAVIALAKYLVNTAKKGFPAAALTIDRVWAAMFTNTPIDEKKLSYLNSSLLQLGESFLAVKTFEADGEAFRLYQMEACIARGLEKSKRLIVGKIEKRLTKPRELTPRSLYQWFQYQQLQQKAFTQLGERKETPYLQSTVDALDSYYFASKLRLHCEMLNYQLAINTKYIFRFASEEDRSHIDQLPNSQLAQLYARAYELLQTENREDLFQAFVELLSNVEDLLARATFTNLYFQGVNYCIQQIVNGYKTFIPLLLACYREGLKHGYLLENGRLTP
ncbi:MAG: hypothetical protein AAFQ37_05820, partial [Bacteroidota bacterium]